MEAFINTALLVGVGEMGDKTQLLALLLAVRYQRSLPILGGIFLATLLTMAVTAAIGTTIAAFVPPAMLRWLLVVMFFAIAAWTLVPDKLDDDEEGFTHRGNAFLTTLVAFFLVEMGDKTQVATIALGAQYHSVLAVAAGTTVGMMIANGPAVFLGEELVKRVSLKATRIAAALLFLVLGLWQLADQFGWL